MGQRRKKQEDVLVARDEKAGETSVVTGPSGKGHPDTEPVKPGHPQGFLHFDRRRGMVDSLFENSYRQYKEPTHFGFCRVTANTADMPLPTIKDFLKDPVANAKILASCRVDTTKYQ